MDFDFTEEQAAVSEAASAIFQGMADTGRLAEIGRASCRERVCLGV